MNWDHQHLQALRVVIQEGQFDKAAEVLHVTPSAISQRIRALEEKAGQVLLIRDQPVRATRAGQVLYRLALQMELLEQEANTHLHQSPQHQAPLLPVAVPSDVLATWFILVMTNFDAQTGGFIEVLVDDQDYTATWLREGRVMGVVTTTAQPIQGCKVTKLTPLSYIPVASPSFVQRYFSGGMTFAAFKIAPVLLFNRKDLLPNRFVRWVCGRPLTPLPIGHFLPSSNVFQDGLVAGLGWSMVPEFLARPHLKSGALVRLHESYTYDMPLYWQAWRLSASRLSTLGEMIKVASRQKE